MAIRARGELPLIIRRKYLELAEEMREGEDAARNRLRGAKEKEKKATGI